MSIQRFAYILSPSYSGSTLLTYLLGVHPEIATIGELKASAMGDIDEYDCSCGVRIRTCPFWQALGEELRRRGSDLDLADFGTHFRTPNAWLTDHVLGATLRGRGLETVRDIALATLPGPRRTFERVLKRNVAVAEAVTAVQGGTVFLDGSKDPIRLKFLLRAGWPAMRVIYMVRDGRAASNSYMRHYNVQMPEAARAWRRTHVASERILAQIPADSWLRVRYEDLCHDPTGMLKRIFTFLGVDASTAPTELNTHEQHILGNAMRLGRSTDIRLDEKWKRALTPADLKSFQQIAGDVNARYEYEA